MSETPKHPPPSAERMADLLTDAELAEVERLDREATAGPWHSTWNDPQDAHDENLVIRSSAEGLDAEPNIVPQRMVVGLAWYDGHNTVCREEDAAFIAAARIGWPRAVADVRALRARVALLEGIVRRLVDKLAISCPQEWAVGKEDPAAIERARAWERGAEMLKRDAEAALAGKALATPPETP